MASVAVFAPLAIGGSSAWAKLGVEAACTLAVAAWALSGPRNVWLTSLPLMIAGLASLQLLPLSDSVLVWLAPVSAGAWKVANAGDPAAWGRISVDPHATVASLRTLLVGLGTVVTVVGLGRYKSHRRLLLGGVAASGAMILAAGLLAGKAGRDAPLLGMIDLRGPLRPNDDPRILPRQSNGVGIADVVRLGDAEYRIDSGNASGGIGSYIYDNHYAGGLVLALPVAIAFLLALTRPAKLTRRGELKQWAGILIAVLAAAAAIWSVTMVASSRAGGAALIVACTALIALTAESLWLRRTAVSLLVLEAVFVAGFLVVLLGDSQWLAENMPEPYAAAAARITSDARTVAAQVAVRMFRASTLLGTGLATYHDIFPRFHDGRAVLFYAHNDYAQLFAETGLIGSAIAAGLAFVLISRCATFCRGATGDYRLLNAGPWAALAGFAVHSAFDWNMHLPANALLAWIVTGLAISSVPTPKREWAMKIASWVPEQVVRYALVAACVVSLGFMARDCLAERTLWQVRDAIVADRLYAKDPNAHPPAGAKLSQAIDAGKRMLEYDRSNPELLMSLGHASLHLAGQAKTPAARDAILEVARRWFRRAQLACATCRGLPEGI